MTDWQYEVIETLLLVLFSTITVCYISDMISSWFKDKPMARRKRK